MELIPCVSLRCIGQQARYISCFVCSPSSNWIVCVSIRVVLAIPLLDLSPLFSAVIIQLDILLPRSTSYTVVCPVSMLQVVWMSLC